MIVTFSGSMLAWVCMKSELNIMPRYASSRSPFVTINLRSGEIDTRGVMISHSKSISGGMTRIATAIASDPIADRYLRFSGLVYRLGAARLYSGHSYRISLVSLETNDRIITMLSGSGLIKFTINSHGMIRKVKTYGRAKLLRDTVHETYTDILKRGIALGEDLDLSVKEDVI